MNRRCFTSASLSFPDTKDAFQVVHDEPVSHDAASGLLNPSAHLTSFPPKSRITYTPIPQEMFRQTLPTADDLRRWQKEFKTDKKTCPDFAPQTTFKPLSLQFNKRVLRPAVTDLNASLPDLRTRATRRTRMPQYLQVTPGQRLPTTHALAWEKIDPSTDSELANYVVSSTHAFSTQWLKHRSLKHRKFDPATHPEFTELPVEHHRLRNRETLHREAMLRVKAMLSKS